MYNVIITKRVRPSAIWEGVSDPVDIGEIPGMFCGYNVEVADRSGRTGWMGCTFVRSAAELNDEFHCWEREDMGLVPTGRIAFRGYYEQYGECYEEVEIDTSCIIGYVD